MSPTYHVVSHSHWDREWYKTFEQFRSMLVRMVDDLLELLRGEPRFRHFTLDGQTIILDDYLAVRPDREKELKELVAAGRLLVGPWYVLPDEFLVSGEATVRNLLRGTSRAREFGGGMDVGYVPDSFGHIAMLPAILRGFGIDAAVLYRGFGGEPGQETSEYRWIAPDGSEVLFCHLFRNGYSTGYFHQDSIEEIRRRFAELKRELDERATTSQRLLLNGGDHHWPDPLLPETLDLLRQTFEGDFVHSTIPAYVSAVKKEAKNLPVVRGELRFGYRYAFAVMGGVYSSRVSLKQMNWYCQNLLQRYAEPLHAWAWSRGMRSQLPLVRHAWKTLMQNHPHDSICGCSIDPVHREMLTRFKAVQDIGGSVVEQALEHLIPRDDCARGDDRCLFLFNPSPFSRKGPAKTDVRFFLQDIVVGLNPDVKPSSQPPAIKGFVLEDADGSPVRFQVLDCQDGYDITYSNFNYPKQTYAKRFSVLVDANDVPPVGFRGYRIRKTDRFPRFASRLRCREKTIENEYVRVAATPRGEFVLTDRLHGTEYRGLNIFESTGDVGDEYNYSNPRKDRRILSTSFRAKIKVTERGPLRGALRVSFTMRVPVSATKDRRARAKDLASLAVETTCYLTEESRLVAFETTVNNVAKDHRFRVLFPSGTKAKSAVADSQFCTVEREQKRYDVRKFTIEHPARVAPMQRFVVVREKKRGLTLLSDGMPEYELMLDGKGTLALTLLRCVGLLAGEDLITRPGGKAGWHNETPDAQCQGSYAFRYGIVAHTAAEAEEPGFLNELAESFHLPFYAVRRKNDNPGSFQDSCLRGSVREVVWSALKQTEDGEDLLVRFYNTSPASVKVALNLHCRIKEAWVSRLDESRLDSISADEGSQLAIPVIPRGIATVRVRIDKGPAP
jgi:mannosylglycerate hydrolase